MSPSSGRRPTLADVAALSGMSKSAVSLILNDRPGSRLSPEAAERVRAAAEELGYRPNPAAQSLRWGRTRTLGFVSDEVTITRFASGMISGALEAGAARDHSVLIAEANGDHDRLASSFQLMLDRRVDGMIVGLMRARRVELPPAPANLPIVIVNGESGAGHASVLPDEREAGHAMARLLTDAGHRRIAVVGALTADVSDPAISVTIEARFAGMGDAFAAAGVRPIITRIDEWFPTLGYETTVRTMTAHPDVTAILASNDSVAFGVYQALASLGLRIPDDVSVASFDDEVLTGYMRPGLTTARLPYEEMARHGVEMLLGDRPLGPHRVGMPVVVRDSIAPPRAR
ncbi:LacI family DNA-binding transcriptional regulator [Microbacterium sp. No. 7]|uniref:LacI family DNA-binding transcriptional regulator n=1 Tax=Microbacterium sp. No. 7 TaxID=1714373 RepID=UPI0006D04B85|nr:LacI family DNA-binding transcriptional regulator [Microbacterium sp. No. 7]ALJ20973.1 hypothetical protein AOA12_14125 [Microbacterium sp. No. 7]